MDQTKKPSGIEMLYRGDPRVCMLLGKQPKPAADVLLRKSCFVYCWYVEGRYMLFHTLTRQVLLMPVTLIDYFMEGKSFPASVLEEKTLSQLYEWYFLVPQDAPESQTYLELKDVLVVKEELPRGITHYVILPTTTCNARCFYCFEQGMRYHKMSRETVEDTLRFIQAHMPEGKKKIHIHWFGGEPMCAPENIDRICQGLTEAGIEYTAEMTSNGSLFTEELAKKAAEEWKIQKIQITLDGMAEEYARRKRYTSAVEKPFETVIQNIHFLLAAGIRVAVRLNVDEDNVDEIYRVADFLKEEFSPDEKKQMQVYAHSLFVFGEQSNGLDACPVGSGKDELEICVMEINDYVMRNGLAVVDLSDLFNLRSKYCMANAPECNAVIDAAGKLFTCEGMPENLFYGDVKKGVDLEAWNRATGPCEVRETCKTCVFLPQCTEFYRCPNQLPFDACRRQEKRKLERQLHLLVADYLEQVRKQQSAKAQPQEAEKPEEAHVSD